MQTSNVVDDMGYAETNVVRVARELGLGYFRWKLVNYFDWLWKNEVKWPSRGGRNNVN